jgi:hypothetical protein
MNREFLDIAEKRVEGDIQIFRHTSSQRQVDRPWCGSKSIKKSYGVLVWKLQAELLQGFESETSDFHRKVLAAQCQAPNIAAAIAQGHNGALRSIRIDVNLQEICTTNKPGYLRLGVAMERLPIMSTRAVMMTSTYNFASQINPKGSSGSIFGMGDPQ